MGSLRCPCARLTLEQNWVPGVSWSYRRLMRRADNPATFICRLSENPGSLLSLLKPSGPIWACIGLASLAHVPENIFQVGTPISSSLKANYTQHNRTFFTQFTQTLPFPLNWTKNYWPISHRITQNQNFGRKTSLSTTRKRRVCQQNTELFKHLLHDDEIPNLHSTANNIKSRMMLAWNAACAS